MKAQVSHSTTISDLVHYIELEPACYGRQANVSLVDHCGVYNKLDIVRTVADINIVVLFMSGPWKTVASNYSGENCILRKI